MNAQTPVDPFVRPAIPDDAEGIAKVHVRGWQEAYVGLLPQEVLDRQSVEMRYRHWSAHLGRPGQRWVFVAIDPAQGVVGFAEAGRRRPAIGAARYDIPVIYVLQSHMRRGLGRRLMHALAGALAAQDTGEISLWALADNRPARAFYEAIGGRLRASLAERHGSGRVVLAGYRWRNAAHLAASTGNRSG